MSPRFTPAAFARTRALFHSGLRVALLLLVGFALRPDPAHAQNLALAFGSTGADVGRAAAKAPNGDLVVAGYFNGTVDFDPGAGTASRTSAGGNDVFATRYAADGSFLSAVTFGSSGTEFGYGVAVDASGNAVVTGYFNGTVDFDPGAGTASRTSAGGNDVFVARYAADGAFLSVVTFGSTGADIGFAVAVDASGNAVVTGSFNGTVDFDPGAGTANHTSAGNTDAYVARYAADGAFVSAVTFGSTTLDAGSAVTVDASGNAVVAGYFNGTVDFDPGAGTVSRTSTGQDGYVARYTSAGALVSVVAFGGASPTAANAVALDASNRAVVVGTYQGTVDFDPGAGTQNRTGAGSNDAYVARYAADGSFVSVATFGSTSADGILAVAMDASDHAVVTGSFNGTVDFDPGAGAENRTSAGFNDVLVARYASDGSFVSTVTFGSTGLDIGYGVAVDASGSAVVTGYFNGTVDFDPGASAENRTSAGGNDVFVARYTADGTLPVELAGFSATTLGRTARLSWTTVSETNNTGFVVERQVGDAWADVSAPIAGQGTTTERTDYAYDVTGLTAGTHTFRLRQTDTDGTVHHSASVTVEIGTDGQMLVTIFGNGSASPRVRIEGDGVVRAEAFDVLGRSVGVLYDGAASGTIEASLPTSLSMGTYVVRVSAAGRTASHVVVVH